MEYKNLLVISHNCFSKTGSNGRTLSNYIKGWKHDKIAQLYIHPEKPDFEVCSQYYCISDSDILKSILRKENPAGCIVKDENKKENNAKKSNNKSVKNSFMFIMRELAWESRIWDEKGLKLWVDTFKPEIILVQAGDSSFLFNIALSIAQKYSAEIVIYNTEGYYFKKTSYLQENKISKYMYPILNKHFKKCYEKLVGAAKCEIYNCSLLAEDYASVLHTNNQVIMNTSEFTDEKVVYPKKKKIIYAGNLGLYRHKSLIEFANALQKVDSNMWVDVYGKIPNERVREELMACQGIRFHGFISYEKLKIELRESQYLLHVESFDQFYKEDLKYAFSTKIADSLAAGSCLFVYAPGNMAISQYLRNSNAAVLINHSEMLVKEISYVLNDEYITKQYSDNGRKLAELNHDIKKNRRKFIAALLD